MRARKVILQTAMAILLATAIQLVGQTPPGGRGRGDPGRGGRGGAGAGNVYNTYDEATLQRGKTLFTAQCGFCHGVNAKGGESGPDLLRAVPVLDDEDGNLIGPIVLNGRGDRGMPKFNLTKEQISDIAAFLHEGIRAAAQRGTYQIQNIVTGNAAAGKAYFNGAGKCNTCHSATGDLRRVGAKYDPVILQGKFLMPRGGRGPYNPAELPSSPVTVSVTLPDGKTFDGRLERIDDFNVALTDAKGEYHSFTRKGDVPKVVRHDPLQAHFDLLPKYSDADMHNLTAYLVTLR
jgi:cytochrome c oxidase cbb3-type subunit III